METLSEREAAVARLVAKGLTAREIAARMGVEVTTVRTYLRRIYVKTGAANRAHLAALVVAAEKRG